MPEFRGVNATKMANSPIDKVDMTDQGGNRRLVYDQIEAAAALGDTIVMGRINKDAKLIDYKVNHDALGANTTLVMQVRPLDVSVGAAVSVSAAPTATSTAGTIVPNVADINLMPYTAIADSEIILLLGGGAAAGTIKSQSEVVHD